MSKAPSAILSDALTSFNRAATLAFTAAQDQARKDVTHATSDARDARRERDEAVNALHTSKLEEQAWKEEAGVWKTAANQAELTINHHLETIAQLREEATQWKNQCLRLEESSRQEAVSWKEQFLRVEQERSKLAQRVEELVAEQLNSGGQAQTMATPYTPMQRYSAKGDLSASARLQRASAIDSRSPGLQLSKSAPSTSKTTLGASKNRPGPNLQLPTPLSENQRGARQRTTHENALVSRPGSTSNGTHQIVIRRVQAVVEVPVKEESIDREDLPDTRISTVTSNIPSTSKPARVTKTSKTTSQTTELDKDTPRAKRKAAMKRAYVEIDDESELGDPSQESRQSDTEEYQPVSDGDDELLIKNRSERHGMKRIAQSVASRRTSDVRSGPKAPPPSKKSRPSAVSKS